jgi:hypothetical protein
MHVLQQPCVCVGAWFDELKCFRYHAIAGWSSLVARRAHNPKVVGSNPTPATSHHTFSRGLPIFESGALSAELQLS